MALSPEQKKYVTIESVIGGVVDVGLSVLFVWLMFRGQTHIARDALIIDAAPQSFMIALMTVLVPTLITRGRLAKKKAPALDAPSKLPRNVILRALVIAIPTTILGVAIHAGALFTAAPDGLAYSTAMIAKAIYGGILGFIIANIAVTSALRDSRAKG